MQPAMLTRIFYVLTATAVAAAFSYGLGGMALGLNDPARLHRLGKQASVKRHQAAGPLLRLAAERNDGRYAKERCRLDLADHYVDMGYSEHAIREYAGLVKSGGEAACAASFGLAAVLVREEEASFWIPWVEQAFQHAADHRECFAAALSRLVDMISGCVAAGRAGDAALLLRIAENRFCGDGGCGRAAESSLAWMRGLCNIVGFEEELLR